MCFRRAPLPAAKDIVMYAPHAEYLRLAHDSPMRERTAQAGNRAYHRSWGGKEQARPQAKAENCLL